MFASYSFIEVFSGVVVIVLYDFRVSRAEII